MKKLGRKAALGSPFSRALLCCATALVAVLASGSRLAAAQPATRDIKLSTIGELPPKSGRWALIIGADAYADPQITPLRGAANDAVELAAALTRYAGFPKDQIILLTTKHTPARNPTRSNILFHLSNLSQLVPEDGLFAFFFAGHGVEREGEAFLLPSDARLTDNLRILHATGISFKNVREWIEEMSVKQVLMFLDACRNNPSAGRGDESNPLTEAFTSSLDFSDKNAGIEAFAVLYATAVGDRAYEYAEKGHGFFTWAIVEGLKGGAANKQGIVTLGALEGYVQEVVPKRVALELGVERVQRPFAEVKGYRADELVIAEVSGRNQGPPEVSYGAEIDPVAARADWASVQDSRNLEDFREFYRKHPDSPLAEQAMEKIEALEWERVRSSGDLGALRAFYEARPHGPHAEEALGLIREIAQRENAHEEILAVLERYRAAFRARDADSLTAVWPSLGNDQLNSFRRAFKTARSLDVRLEIQGEPRIEEDRAIVRCEREIDFVSAEGQRRSNRNSVTVELQRRPDGWVIRNFQID